MVSAKLKCVSKYIVTVVLLKVEVADAKSIQNTRHKYIK